MVATIILTWQSIKLIAVELTAFIKKTNEMVMSSKTIG